MAKLRKMLSNWEAPYIQSIVKVIETQSKEALLDWTLDYSHEVLLPIWQKSCPVDRRPLNAILVARKWMHGEIKMPEAKWAILECHAGAREAEHFPAAQAAARAIGQAASIIHVPRHCMGVVFYGALAVAYDELGTTAKWVDLEECAAQECSKILKRLLEIAVEGEPNPAKITWFC